MKSLALFIAIVLNAAVVLAQAEGQPPDAPPPLGAGEVQKLLDGYAIVQAQEFLGMTDAQFGPFLPKLRALQDVRRRNEQERFRLLLEMRRITNGRAAGNSNTENDLRDRIRALRELDTRAFNEVQRAHDAIDQSLDVRQQARFRLFEQEIEQRKLQLLMRARQQNRANRPLARP